MPVYTIYCFRVGDIYMISIHDQKLYIDFYNKAKITYSNISNCTSLKCVFKFIFFNCIIMQNILYTSGLINMGTSFIQYHILIRISRHDQLLYKKYNVNLHISMNNFNYIGIYTICKYIIILHVYIYTIHTYICISLYIMDRGLTQLYEITKGVLPCNTCHMYSHSIIKGLSYTCSLLYVPMK